MRFPASFVSIYLLMQCGALKNPYTHENEKSEYEISMLAGPISPLHPRPCKL